MLDWVAGGSQDWDMDIVHFTEYGVFEWDSEKNVRNKRKHGISFELACEAFGDPKGIHILDEIHGYDEERWQLIGETKDGRLLLLVIYTERSHTRLISARYAVDTEIEIYVDRT